MNKFEVYVLPFNSTSEMFLLKS